MNSIDIALCTNNWWNQICKKIHKAVVFLDDASAECLHWNGGLLRLLDSGADDVKELSSFESCSEFQKKAVFITTSPLLDVTSSIIHDIIQASSLQYCIVITAASLSTHNYAKRELSENPATFEIFENLMLNWMGDLDSIAEVFYFPIFAASLSPSLFVTPAFQSLFPLLQSDISKLDKTFQNQNSGKPEYKTTTKLPELELSHLPHRLKVNIKQFVSCLSSLFESLNVQEECFSIGHTSRIIASELASLPVAKNRRKSAQNKIAVLFVDRSLDLTSPCGHQLDTLWDKLTHVLPQLPGHFNDMKIDMTSLVTSSHAKSSFMVPGCLAHPEDKLASKLLNSFLTNKYKESLMDINRNLVEAISKENFKLSSKTSQITPEELSNRLTLFQGNIEAIKNHRGLLQLTTATVEALRHTRQSTADDLLVLEQILLHYIANDEGSSAVNQIIQKMSSYKDCGLNFKDILLLLVYFYSLKGNDLPEMVCEENKLKVALEGMLLDMSKEEISDLAKSIVGEEFDDVSIQSAVQDIFFVLDAISKTRSNLEDIRSVFDRGDNASPPIHKPLLKQVVDAVFDPKKVEIADIEYKSSGLKNLLKTGFSLFMNVSKPHPSNYPVLVIFVVGGITSTELKMIQDAVAAHKTNTQVIVGSTQVLNFRDTINHLFVKDINQ